MANAEAEIVVSVYREVWNEFYSWETDHCQQIISCLSLEDDPASGPSEATAKLDWNLVDPSFDTDSNEDDDSLSFSVVDIDLGDPAPLPDSQTISVEYFEAYPTYESCALASKNITPRPDEQDESSFIAYATSHDWLKFANTLPHGFVWQNEFLDPDVEMIQLETVRRLHFGYDFALDDIDRLGILRATRIDNESGLLWDTSQRDILNWPGSQLSPFNQLPSTFHCTANDLQSRVNHMVSSFCPKLNCVQSFCPTHTSPSPVFDAVKPTVTSLSMISDEGTPCGDLCFRHKDVRVQTTMEAVIWDTADVETLTSILKIVPDLLPCELSILCQKQCCEIFAYRSKIFSDDSIQEHLDEEIVSSVPRRRKNHFVDNDTGKFMPLGPCYHKGTCDRQSGCPCSLNNSHCERNCRCALDCQIRWKGCDCKKNSISKTCTKKCRCAKAKRECDPDVCISCHARSKKSCRNVKIQRGTKAVIEVKRAEFGLGGFATSEYAINDLIGEYIGTHISVDDPLPQPRHNRGYVFDLNVGMYLDAARAGNETRFLNHKTPPNNNCRSDVLLVNGEHRIGLFATKKIMPGEEILLNYGDRYWEDGIGQY